MAPVGGKGAGEAATVVALALAVLPEAIPALIDLLKGWLLRDRRLRLRLQFGDATAEIGYDPAALTPAELEGLIVRVRRQLRPEGGG